jgi:hypothetical protein
MVFPGTVKMLHDAAFAASKRYGVLVVEDSADSVKPDHR